MVPLRNILITLKVLAVVSTGVSHNWSGVAIDDLPHLVRWRDQIRARAAVQRGIEMPPSSFDRDGDSAEQAKAFSDKARNMIETGQSRAGGV